MGTGQSVDGLPGLVNWGAHGGKVWGPHNTQQRCPGAALLTDVADLTTVMLIIIIDGGSGVKSAY